MKKLFLMVAICALIMGAVSQNVMARGIGIKGGYSLMQNDYNDYFEDTWNGGVFFDMGTFMFQSLRFKPSVDYLKLEFNDENANPKDFADLWGIHFDWYWYFMGNAALSPFIGFGPTLNYYNYERNDEEDSDAGVDLFGGLAFAIAGTPFELFIEGRYKIVDIAAASDDNIGQVNLGLQFRF